jgi:hypothetical protein
VKRVAVVLAATVAFGAQSTVPANTCALAGRPHFLPAVPEASGITQAAGVLWTHNDSDGAVLFRLDASGRSAPVAVAGAVVQDWEDLASAPCPSGMCLYIADIGDNRGVRERITIYMVPLPGPDSTSTPPATATHVRYPDGPHDAEALLVTRQAGTFVITKDVPSRVYHMPASANPGETGTLTFVRTLNEEIRITGAAASRDGRWVALRSNSRLLIYTLENFVKGRSPIRVDLVGAREPQGEGLTFGGAGELYLVSEGGRKTDGGVLTRIRCDFLQ